MSTITTFLLKSSADPKQTSATVKFALLGIIPYIMQVTNLVCEFGSQCYSIDPNLLETIASALAEGTYYLLLLISVMGTLWGASRKLWRTVTGKNLALKKRV